MICLLEFIKIDVSFSTSTDIFVINVYIFEFLLIFKFKFSYNDKLLLQLNNSLKEEPLQKKDKKKKSKYNFANLIRAIDIKNINIISKIGGDDNYSSAIASAIVRQVSDVVLSTFGVNGKLDSFNIVIIPDYEKAGLHLQIKVRLRILIVKLIRLLLSILKKGEKKYE